MTVTTHGHNTHAISRYAPVANLQTLAAVTQHPGSKHRSNGQALQVVPVDAASLRIVKAAPEPEQPAVARAYVPVPPGYFQMDDEEAAPFDEAIADALMEQFGIEDEE